MNTTHKRLITIRTLLFLVHLAMLLVLTAPGLQALAAEYHVSTDACASDDNDGLAAKCGAGGKGPWQSIEHGLDQLAPGDILSLAPGVYEQYWVSVNIAGKDGRPITMAAEEPGTAILDGSKAPEGACGLFIEQGAGHLIFDGLVIRNMPESGMATDEEADQVFEDITIKRCEMRDNGYSGLELAATQGFIIEDSVFESNGYYGVNVIGSKDGSLSSSHGVVQRCEFNNHVGEQGHGFAINQGHDIVVRECLARHNRIHGFDLSDWPKQGALSSRVHFYENRSIDNGKGGFAVNSDSSQVDYIRNVAWNNGAHWAFDENAPGFWCYEGCRDVTWINNTSVGNSASGFHVEDRAGVYDGKSQTTSLTFINNIAWENGQAKWKEMYGLYVSKAGWQLTLKNNNFGAGKVGAKVVGLDMVDDSGRELTAGDLNDGDLPMGNMSEDPEFTDEDGGDFTLSPDSPMIDAGADIEGRACGSALDLGAYEHCP